MATLQQPIRIRLQHNILASGEAIQYDTYREFHFIFDDYEIPEGTTDIRIYLEKPSGRAIYNYGTLINGEVIYQPTSQTLAEYGTCTGQVQIIKNAAILTTFPFKLEVEKNMVDDTEFVSKDEFLILDELIKTTREQENELEQKEKDRDKAEKERVTNETARETNEGTRKTQEEARQDNEESRDDGERKRKENEETRQKNEENRAKAEKSREDAEELRVSEAANAVKSCNDAKKSVDDTLALLNQELKSAINDEATSSITTYSSTKIVNMFENQMIVSKYEPQNQQTGGLWLLEE